MKKTTILAIVSGIILMLPHMAVANDKQLEKRLAVLEAKMAHIDAIMEENKQLKARLQKAEERLEKATAQKLAIFSPAKNVVRVNTSEPVAPPNAPNIIPAASSIISQGNWSGFYAGINAGYGKNNAPIIRQTYVPGGFNNDSNTSYGEGPLVGGQIGFNYQFSSNVILGFETDFDWANVVLSNYTSNSDNSYGGNFGINANSYNSRYGLDWLGTARLRFGYSFGNLMPYITGGVSYGQLSSYENRWYNSASPFSSTLISNTASNFMSGNASKINVGWTAGVGAEYSLTNNWSIKTEYLYAYLGSLTRYDQYFDPSYQCPGCSFAHVSLNNFGVHQARIGLNYHTNWLKSFSVNAEQY